MTGLAASPPTTINETNDALLPVWQFLVGDTHSLRVQAQEGRAANKDDKGHADSWGVGWIDRNGETSLIRQTGSAYDSGYFVFASESAARGAAGSGPGSVVIGHLRKASCGDITSENAHPVRVDYAGANGRETLLLAHNGTIRKPLLSVLRDDLEPTERPEKSSDSDTVVLAGWIGARLEAQAKANPNAPLFTGLSDALTDLFARAEKIAPSGDLTKTYSSVCLLIAHPSGLFALRQFTKEPDYYTLFSAPLSPNAEKNEIGGFVVSSEPTDNEKRDLKWSLLEPGVLTFYPAQAGGEMKTATVAPPFSV